ncbi:MAG: response regulator [Myxococcales bacterium]|nr:response regulator [Myxococcales bacterium]MCB9643612.1 response regulator [Myxococcales bacterium]
MNQFFSESTVMIIDDTPANLGLLEEVLSKQGYRVVAFPTGKHALKAAQKRIPDLILLDIMMPEESGFEVCQKLKADSKLCEIPVIFISALDDTNNKVKALSRGGVDYITKPFQEDEVLARVKTHLSLRRMQQELERHNNYLEELVQEKVKEISDSQLATILAVSKLAEYRDEETGLHIERTRIFCKLLAQELQKNEDFSQIITHQYIENIYQAAPLHDIGKVGVPDHILLKPGKLTSDEFTVMKSHVTIGASTLQKIFLQYPHNNFIKMGIELTRSHHEKWDGSGYPDGIKGEDIPLSARIMALADVYDALRSKRIYKDAFSHQKSMDIITEGRGKHFDPAIVDAFLALEEQFDQIRNQMEDNFMIPDLKNTDTQIPALSPKEKTP